MTRLAILLRTSFLILTLICASQTMARSQKYKVTIKVKEQKLLDVFKSIQQQTNLIVFYSNTILNDQEKVSIQVKDEPLEKVLDQIVAGKALKYEVQEKYIVIAPKEEKKGGKEIKEETSVEDVAPLPPPTIDVSGRVTDEDGNPLMGASVMIKGTKIGTQTNAEGYFTLKGIDNDAILEISFIGFEKQQISVKGVNSVRVVVLKRADDLLSEVIVRPYHKEIARYSLSPVSRVTSKEIMQTPVDNPLLVLQGRVTGVNVVQGTGINGAAPKIRVMGDRSITSGNNPLIVVDGVPYPIEQPNASFITINYGDPNGLLGSPLSFLNMNDIESIDVLKDADATSIYGSRAANGAILITTKKGKPGKLRVDVNIQQGWSKVSNRMDLMNTAQYLEMRKEAMKNSNLIPSDQTGLPAPYWFAPDLTLWDQNRYTDWQKVLIGGTAHMSSVNTSLSGGTASSTYRVGINYRRNTDVFPGDHAMKSAGLSFSLNTASSNQRFKFQLSGGYSYTDNTLPGQDLTADALGLAPNAPSLFSTNTLNWAANSQGVETWKNPLVNSFYSENKQVSKALTTNADISYQIATGLQFRVLMGYNQVLSENRSKTPEAAIAPSERLFIQRSNSFYLNQIDNLTVEPQLHYNTSLKRLQLKAIAGGAYIQNSTLFENIQGRGYTSDLLLNGTAGSATLSYGLGKTIYRYNAGFGHLGLILDGRYIVNINARRDGSSRFGDENKLNTFASIGTGWIFSEETWMKKNFPWLSFGKLRANYGSSGNDDLADYSYISRNFSFSNTSFLLYGNAPSMYRNNLHNPYLQWEDTRKFSTGIDLGFLKDRVQLAATYSLDRSSNQLMSVNLPSVTGFGNVSENFPATVQNINWEFSLSSVNISRKKFNWNSRFNITISRNKLVSFPGIENTIYASGTLGVVVGQPLFVTQVSEFLGMNPLTGVYLINTASKRYFPTAPAYYGGMQQSFRIKSFSLDLLFQFVRQFGSRLPEFYSGVGIGEVPGGFYQGRGNQPVSVLDRWQKPGDIAFYTSFTGTGNGSILSQIRDSDKFYSLDASFMRLKNASVSWQMPNRIIKKLGIQNGRIYANGQNLLTFTKYPGLDPENRSGRGLPPLRTWTIGVQVSL